MNELKDDSKNITSGNPDTEIIFHKSRMFRMLCDLIKTSWKYGTYIACILTIRSLGLSMLQSEPDVLYWFAKVFENMLKLFELNDLTQNTLIVVQFMIMYYHTQRNLKLVKANGELRHKLEANDASHARSGLNSRGVAEDDEV